MKPTTMRDPFTEAKPPNIKIPDKKYSPKHTRIHTIPGTSFFQLGFGAFSLTIYYFTLCFLIDGPTRPQCPNPKISMATPKRVSHSLKSMCGRTLYIILLGLDNSLQPMGVLYLFFANHCINHVTDGAGFSTEDLPIVNLWIARFYTVYTLSLIHI